MYVLYDMNEINGDISRMVIFNIIPCIPEHPTPANFREFRARTESLYNTKSKSATKQRFKEMKEYMETP